MRSPGIAITPIVDMTNVAVQTRVRSEEFQKLPVGRSYQTLIGRAPGRCA